MGTLLSELSVVDHHMQEPEGTARHFETKQSFRDIFCAEEVEFEKFNKKFFGADALMLIPGKEVVGKGLRNEVTQCHVVIRNNEGSFIYNNGEEVHDEKNRLLDRDCMLIFLGDAEEAFILLPDEGSPKQRLFRLGEDVEIGVFLETELYRGRNGYYLCLIKDAESSMNMCSVTADPRSAEFMFRLFLYECS